MRDQADSSKGPQPPKAFGRSAQPAPLFGQKPQTPATPAKPVAALKKMNMLPMIEKSAQPRPAQPLPPPSNLNTMAVVSHARGGKKLEELSRKILEELYKSVNLVEFADMSPEEVQAEIRHAIEVICTLRQYILTTEELDTITTDICNEMLGFGPLEVLLARDDISDIMVNGPDNVYIELGGKVRRSDVRFRDNAQLTNVCCRIDESSPMCDARLHDGSRRITHITEVCGMEGDVVTLQDLFLYDITGEDAQGRVIGKHSFSGVQPRFLNKAKERGLAGELIDAMGSL